MQSPKPIVQEAQTPEIGMGPNRLFANREVLWSLDRPRLACAVFLRMMLQQCTLRKPKFVVEDPQDDIVDLEGLFDERNDGRNHAVVDGGRIRPSSLVRPGQRIIFGDVDEFDFIEFSRGINGVGTSKLVS